MSTSATRTAYACCSAGPACPPPPVMRSAIAAIAASPRSPSRVPSAPEAAPRDHAHPASRVVRVHPRRLKSSPFAPQPPLPRPGRGGFYKAIGAPARRPPTLAAEPPEAAPSPRRRGRRTEAAPAGVEARSVVGAALLDAGRRPAPDRARRRSEAGRRARAPRGAGSLASAPFLGAAPLLRRCAINCRRRVDIVRWIERGEAGEAGGRAERAPRRDAGRCTRPPPIVVTGE